MHAIISIIHQDLQKAILKYTRGIKSRQDKNDFHNELSLIKQYYEDQGMLKKIDTSFLEQLVYANYGLPMTFKLTPNELMAIGAKDRYQHPEPRIMMTGDHSQESTQPFIKAFLDHMREDTISFYSEQICNLLKDYFSIKYNGLRKPNITVLRNIIDALVFVLEKDFSTPLKAINEETLSSHSLITDLLVNFYANDAYYFLATSDEMSIPLYCAIGLWSNSDPERHACLGELDSINPYILNCINQGIHKKINAINQLSEPNPALKSMVTIISKTNDINMQYLDELEKEYINDHFAYNESAQTLINLYDLVAVKHCSQNTLIKSSVNLIYRKYSTKDILQMSTMPISEPFMPMTTPSDSTSTKATHIKKAACDIRQTELQSPSIFEPKVQIAEPVNVLPVEILFQ